MDCTKCGSPTRVIETSVYPRINRRRRECRRAKCKHRFTTYETLPKHIDAGFLQDHTTTGPAPRSY